MLSPPIDELRSKVGPSGDAELSQDGAQPPALTSADLAAPCARGELLLPLDTVWNRLHLFHRPGYEIIRLSNGFGLGSLHVVHGKGDFTDRDMQERKARLRLTQGFYVLQV